MYWKAIEESCLLTCIFHFVEETSLLLGNLIDVLEEIKLSKFELLNLTSAAFVLESQTCMLSISSTFLSSSTGVFLSKYDIINVLF